jgi:hypothetical protein
MLQVKLLELELVLVLRPLYVIWTNLRLVLHVVEEEAVVEEAAVLLVLLVVQVNRKS